MKNRQIILFALAGVGGISIGGAVWGLLGVAALLTAVCAVCEQDRQAAVNRELDRVYGAIPASRVRPRLYQPKEFHLVPAR